MSKTWDGTWSGHVQVMLEEILRDKKEEIRAKKSPARLKELKARIRDLASPRGLMNDLLKPAPIHLIAEIKKASPSRGIIRKDFDPVDIAKVYQEHGATALSVLTDEHFFQGHLDLLGRVRQGVALPVLQKDFLLDAYQVYEARAAQADAILLIAIILDRRQLADYHALGKELGMDVICEVHTEKELEQVMEVAEVIGINNRDLKSFKTDLETTFRLIREVPDEKVVISESGISSRQEVLRLMEAGVDAILVGESLMRVQDIGAKVDELLGKDVNR
ncbi:MAG: indole-3-glycerol phosphate synthase TrpC [Nitrospiria bacterium]